MADAGATPRFVPSDFTVEGGRRAAVALLSAPTRPTAIFAASDEMAYGALTAAREIGLRVPEDLSVMGVDGHDFAELFGLTTIDQFPHAQGERAGEAILAAVAGDGEPVGTSSSLPFALVTRRTTAPPRDGRAERTEPLLSVTKSLVEPFRSGAGRQNRRSSARPLTAAPGS